MENTTVSVPEDVYRTARARAAQLGTSLSALIADFLTSLSEREAEFTRLEANQQRVQSETRRFRAGDRLSRDAVHDRAIR